METIRHFLGIHKKETAWIFGKGPGIDRFDMSKAGSLRICINESTLVVHEPRYFFAHDEKPILRVSKKWNPSCVAILQPIRGKYAVRCGIPEDCIYTYDIWARDPKALTLSPEVIANKAHLYAKHGTVTSALHFCYMAGVTRVNLVGFEGKGGYAPSLGLRDDGGHHDEIHEEMVHMMNCLKMDYSFLTA